MKLFNPDEISQILSSRQRRMEIELNKIELTKSAVLVLLIGEGSDTSVLLTRRTSKVEIHKGQISFPGGAFEIGDLSPIDTALRETKEETGIDSKSLKILGILDEQTTPSGFCIVPVAAWAPNLPIITPNHEEVDEIITPPLSFFADKRNLYSIPIMRNGKINDVYFYFYGKNQIWGVTARILHDFIEILNQSDKKP